MILVDTSIWVDHLRRGDRRVARLLDEGMVLLHPWVFGELALGGLRRDGEARRELLELPSGRVASADEVIALVEGRRLAGRGIGFVDAGLVASARLSGASLWTADRQLHAVADELGVAFSP